MLVSLKVIQQTGWRVQTDDTQIGHLYYLTAVQLCHLQLQKRAVLPPPFPVLGLFMAEGMVRFMWCTVINFSDHSYGFSDATRTSGMAAPATNGEHRAHHMWWAYNCLETCTKLPCDDTARRLRLIVTTALPEHKDPATQYILVLNKLYMYL